MAARFSLSERWLFLGPFHKERADELLIRLRGDEYWLCRGAEALGPFGGRQVVRAYRVALTPVIDGCELGSLQLAFDQLAPTRPRWKNGLLVAPADLPPSVTMYDAAALAPCRGCCTVFDAPPPVQWEPHLLAPVDLGRSYAHGGRMTRPWNAHFEGALVFTDDRTMTSELVVIESA
jgi:hypothetical protein